MAGGVQVGVDGSEPSLLALDWAAAEATVRGEPLTVHYVINDDVAEPSVLDDAAADPDTRAAWPERAREQARRARPALEVCTLGVLVGAAVEALERRARQQNLCVLGRIGGSSAFAGMLIGSVSDRVPTQRAGEPRSSWCGAESTAADQRPCWSSGWTGAADSAAAASSPSPRPRGTGWPSSR